MKILFLGDVVGKPGRRALLDGLENLKGSLGADFAIVNGENAAGGSGLTVQCYKDIIKAGADVVTTGDHVWRKKEIRQVMESGGNVLRPMNYPATSPGDGWRIFKTSTGIPVAVCLLIGRVFMDPAECPFLAADRVLDEIGDKAKVIVFDVHAEATSEKIAMGWHLDGRASAVIGTHTHVQTADECILPKGTAYITDVGMTGPHDSVLGRRTDRILKFFMENYPTSFDVAKGDARMSGVIVDIDETTGAAQSIDRVVERV